MPKKQKNKAKSASTPVLPPTSIAKAQNSKKAAAIEISERATTGVARRGVGYKNILVDNFSLNFHGALLVTDTIFQLSYGHRYGLVGPNGCGKSTLLDCIGAREIPIPGQVDIYHVVSEVEASDETALECVMSVDEERVKLEDELQQITDRQIESGEELTDEDEERTMEIYERLDELDAVKAESKAAKILCGLGFTAAMQKKKTREFSGGWRMRIALAKALFVSPSLLLLDEPTNHLDLEACVWLEEYLKKWDKILLMVSHSQDFLNGVCTDIIHLNLKRLWYYPGNYDIYIQTRLEKEEYQMRQFKWEQDQMKHMKDFIARFGHGSAKLARQAKSREKSLKRMQERGLTNEIRKENNLIFYFPDPDYLSPPVLQFKDVSFAYSKERVLYKDLNIGFDLDSRVALVGPNGVGKTTLLKLITQELRPTTGFVSSHNHLRIARFTQHFVDQLDMTKSALQHMNDSYPDNPDDKMRGWLSRYGLSGGVQMQKMGTLSDGQKSRVVFSWMSFRTPHLLLLDEPTNHLDLETIDALAEAINEFQGGVILVSHDMRLIDVVAEEIWLCKNQTVTKFEGDIQQYKDELKKHISAL